MKIDRIIWRFGSHFRINDHIAHILFRRCEWCAVVHLVPIHQRIFDLMFSPGASIFRIIKMFLVNGSSVGTLSLAQCTKILPQIQSNRHIIRKVQISSHARNNDNRHRNGIEVYKIWMELKRRKEEEKKKNQWRKKCVVNCKWEVTFLKHRNDFWRYWLRWRLQHALPAASDVGLNVKKNNSEFEFLSVHFFFTVPNANASIAICNELYLRNHRPFYRRHVWVKIVNHNKNASDIIQPYSLGW